MLMVMALLAWSICRGWCNEILMVSWAVVAVPSCVATELNLVEP